MPKRAPEKSRHMKIPKSLALVATGIATAAAALTALALLAGCATYKPQPLDPAASLNRLETRTLADAGLRDFLAQNGHPLSPASAALEWDLEQLTLAAFYFSPSLDAARADLAAACAGAQTARAWQNPTFAFTPGYNVDAAAGVTPWILGYTLNLPLEIGLRKPRIDAAARREETARLALATIAWSVRASLRNALIELRAAQTAAAAWRAQKTTLTGAGALLEQQVRAGEISPIEAAPDRLALARVELDLSDNEHAARAALLRIAEIIGVPPAALDETNMRFAWEKIEPPETPTPPAPTATEARLWAATNHPALAAALAAYAETESTLQLEIRRQYPQFTLGPGYELDQGEGKWTLSLALTLPIFDRNKGPIAAALAQRDAQAARFLELQTRVMADVDRALAAMQTAARDTTTARQMRETAAQLTRARAAQLAAGDITRVEQARTELDLADALRAELDATKRAALAAAALEDAMRRPLTLPEPAWTNPPRDISTPQNNKTSYTETTESHRVQ